jgi:hypothetical protein
VFAYEKPRFGGAFFIRHSRESGNPWTLPLPLSQTLSRFARVTFLCDGKKVSRRWAKAFDVRQSHWIHAFAGMTSKGQRQRPWFTPWRE